MLYMDENKIVTVGQGDGLNIDKAGNPPKSMHVDDLIAHFERGVYEKRKYNFDMWADLQQHDLDRLTALKNGTKQPLLKMLKQGDDDHFGLLLAD